MTTPMPPPDHPPVTASPGGNPAVTPPLTPPDTLRTGDVTWITVTEACARAGVAKRTVRRWIAEARVVSRLEGEPGKQARTIRADTLPPLTAAGDILDDDTVTDPPSLRGAPGVRLNQRDSRAPGDVRSGVPSGSTGAGDSGLERLVSSQAEEIQQLRAQLDLRAQELQRHAIAEEQLRVMLMKLQATNAELAGALVQKALPPAPETGTPAPPQKTRWWTLRGRR